jgi:predicted DNA-binding transcriptional regulator AlpA
MISANFDKESALKSHRFLGRGLNRQQVANYIGVSCTLFDTLVREGLFPKPIRIKSRVIWDRHQIDQSFDDIANSSSNPWDIAMSQVEE